MNRARLKPVKVPSNPMPTIAVGLAVIFVGLGGFAAWAAFTDIASAIVASGTVKVLTDRKQVQTSEGGVVVEIAVHDGAKVAIGDVLIRLDDTSQRERLGQLQEEITGLTGQSTAKAEQMEVVAGQRANIKPLVDKGLVQRSQLLDLQRESLRLKGDKAEIDSNIARSKRLVSEAQHALDQTVIRATENGVVVGLSIHTVGGVVQPGATLLEIVPTQDNLVVEARIRPVDMDNVTVGLEVEVVFPAFSQRRVLRMSGVVNYLSADALTDVKTGATFYVARVTLTSGELTKLGAFKLLPGMPAEIFIKTGDQSPLAYLTEPLRESLSRAWREP